MARQRWKERNPHTYHKRSPEKRKEHAQNYRKKLTDGYVFWSLAQRTDLKREDVPEEVIAFKRALMMLTRLVREERSKESKV